MKKILFMGTPEISAICLEKLIETSSDETYRVVGVCTGEDKPRGRGNVLTPTPVKSAALAAGIPVYTPKTLRDEAFSSLLSSIAPDLIVVVAYGKILPESVLNAPPFGAVNVHVSLLPKYRGAAPMQRAIIDGESETGVTLMQMDAGLDTGDILAQTAFPIGPEDDFETVHDRSALEGGRMLAEYLPRLFAGELVPKKQSDETFTYAAKITKEECELDFSKSAAVLDRFIRGVTPIPLAYTYLKGKTVKILKAVPAQGKGAPGEVIALDGSGDGAITVACGEGALRILRLCPEGKGKMSAGDFIRGRQIARGDVFGRHAD